MGAVPSVLPSGLLAQLALAFEGGTREVTWFLAERRSGAGERLGSHFCAKQPKETSPTKQAVRAESSHQQAQSH